MSEDINQEILVELRKIRTISRRLCYLIGFFIIVCMVVPFLRDGQRQTSHSYSWTQVTAALEQGDTQKALSIAKWLVIRQPDYPYGHACLGYVYLTINNLPSALNEYSRAYQLFPSEDAQKDLDAVRKRMSSGTDFKYWP